LNRLAAGQVWFGRASGGTSAPVSIALLGAVLLLGACGSWSSVPVCPQADCPGCPTPTSQSPDSVEARWCSSGHADARSEAFTHWDGDDPPEIPAECAMCHSKPGYLDFLGVDRTEAGQVDRAAEVGTTVVCYVCHTEAAVSLDSVVLACGARVTDLGDSAGCLACHQGRACTDTVNRAVADAGLIDDDETSPKLVFVNSHAISGATSFGGEVRGAFEYEGKAYSGRFYREEEFFPCVGCHDPHSLEVQIESCRACHAGTWQDPKQIRAEGTDYDGDGDTQEGIAGEIETIQGELLGALQAYAKDRAGVPIGFDGGVYPYFFIDVDNDGEADPEEATFGNSYNGWTPRLLRAAYNYAYVLHDPGAYAHNSDYILQVLYDSLGDVGGDTSGMTRPRARAGSGPG
jgi:hypothetical protein